MENGPGHTTGTHVKPRPPESDFRIISGNKEQILLRVTRDRRRKVWFRKQYSRR